MSTAWNNRRARAELLRLAADHIEDGTFAVCGWRIVEIATSGAHDACEEKFRNAIREHLEWDEDMIDEAVARVRTPWRPCATCGGHGTLPIPQVV